MTDTAQRQYTRYFRRHPAHVYPPAAIAYWTDMNAKDYACFDGRVFPGRIVNNGDIVDCNGARHFLQFVQEVTAEGELLSEEAPIQLGANQNVFGGIEPEAPTKDNVLLPEHYARFEIEPIRFVVENLGPTFLQGNIIKYVMRADAKNGVEDLKKARRYVDMLIAHAEGRTDWWTPQSSPSAEAYTQTATKS